MIKFQQSAQSIMDSRPWAVVVRDDGGILHGRPDANHLVGFGPIDTYEVDLFWKDALEHPEKAIGLCPTFIGLGGDMFTVGLLVESAEKYEASEEAIQRLADSEATMRAALEA